VLVLESVLCASPWESVLCGFSCGERAVWLLLWRACWVAYLEESVLGACSGERAVWLLLWRACWVLVLESVLSAYLGDSVLECSGCFTWRVC
jgi:hypothetical protein